MQVPGPSSELKTSGRQCLDGSTWSQVAIVCGVFAIALLPTTPLLQFCRTPENLVIAAALEIRRDGHWLLPTLEGEPRTVKPPLPTWITAAAIRPETVAAMSSSTISGRDKAARWLAIETRWPAVAIAVATLAATAELGRILSDRKTPDLEALLLCASGFLFLRFATEASTDTSLMLWVVVTNICLARAVFFDQRWLGCVGAGVALGLALMSKGPVAIAQTIVPMSAVLIWKRPSTGAGSRWIVPTVVALICCLAIALPWPLLVMMRSSHQLRGWIEQLRGQDAPERSDPIWNYPLRLLEGVAPCVLLLAVGIWQACRSRARGAMTALALLIVPILIMSFFKDRKDRYLLPMIPAAAVLSAIGLRSLRSGGIRWHWVVCLLIGVGLPMAGMTRLLSGIDGQPWLSIPFGLCAAALAGAIVFTATIGRRSVAIGTFGMMLVVQYVFVVGYGRSEGGQSDMLPLARSIWSVAPDAQMINGQPTDVRTSVDLSIYLNRATRWIPPEKWRSLQPGDLPRVVILLQHAGEPPPVAPGWSVLSSIPHGKERWWALMMPKL